MPTSRCEPIKRWNVYKGVGQHDAEDVLVDSYFTEDEARAVAHDLYSHGKSCSITHIVENPNGPGWLEKVVQSW